MSYPEPICRQPEDPTAMDAGQKFRLQIVRECARTMLSNPLAETARELGLPVTDPQTIEAARPRVLAWNQDLRASAFIFGDSYAGMSGEEARSLLVECGFQHMPGTCPADQLGETELETWLHDSLSGVAVVAFDAQDRLRRIKLRVRAPVDSRTVRGEMFCGMGAEEVEVQGGVLHAKFDCTGGLHTKTHVLRQMVACEPVA